MPNLSWINWRLWTKLTGNSTKCLNLLFRFGLATAVDVTSSDDDDDVADAFDAEVHVNVVEVAVRASEFGHNCVSVLSLVDDYSPGDAWDLFVLVDFQQWIWKSAVVMIPESFGTRNVYEQQPQQLRLTMKHEWKSEVVRGADDDPNCPHSYHQDARNKNGFRFWNCLYFAVCSLTKINSKINSMYFISSIRIHTKQYS